MASLTEKDLEDVKKWDCKRHPLKPEIKFQERQKNGDTFHLSLMVAPVALKGFFSTIKGDRAYNKKADAQSKVYLQAVALLHERFKLFDDHLRPNIDRFLSYQQKFKVSASASFEQPPLPPLIHSSSLRIYEQYTLSEKLSTILLLQARYQDQDVTIIKFHQSWAQYIGDAFREAKAMRHPIFVKEKETFRDKHDHYLLILKERLEIRSEH